MGHHKIDISVVREKSNPVGIGTHKIGFLSIDYKIRARSAGIAGNG
jgi:hypothetical protein